MEDALIIGGIVVLYFLLRKNGSTTPQSLTQPSAAGFAPLLGTGQACPTDGTIGCMVTGDGGSPLEFQNGIKSILGISGATQVSGGYQVVPASNALRAWGTGITSLPTVPAPPPAPPPPPVVSGGTVGTVGSGGNPLGSSLRPGVSAGTGSTLQLSAVAQATIARKAIQRTPTTGGYPYPIVIS